MKKITYYTLASIVFMTNLYANEEIDNLGQIEVISHRNRDITNNIFYNLDLKTLQSGPILTNDDVLKMLPGVQVAGTTSTVQRYKIRSVPDQYLDVSVDGARQEGQNFPHAGNFGIDPEILKKIDVSVGNSSVLTNSNSLAGKLQFTTVDAEDLLLPEQQFGNKITLGANTNGKGWQTAYTTYGRINQLDLLAYVNYRQQQDANSANHTKIRDKGDLTNLLLKTKYNVSDDMELSLSHEYYNNSSKLNAIGNLSIDSSMGMDDALYAIKRQSTNFKLSYDPIDQQLINLKFNLYNNQYNLTNADQTTMRMNISNGKFTTYGFNIENSSLLQMQEVNNTFIYGLDYFDNKQVALETDIQDKSKYYSLFIGDKISYNKFIIVPAIRYNTFQLTNDEIALAHMHGKFIATKTKFNKKYHKLSKSLNLSYELTDHLTLFSNYTELFKGPNNKGVIGMYSANMPGSSIKNDPNLQAITGENTELGFNYNFTSIFADNDRFNLNSKFFHTIYKNFTKKDIDPNNPSKQIWTNIPKAKLKGLEVLAKYRVNNVELKFGYSSVRNKIIETNKISAYNKGDEILTNIGDSYSVGFNYLIQPYDLSIGIDSQFVQKIIKTNLNAKNMNRERVIKPSYSVTDVYINWQPTEQVIIDGLSITVGVSNIFNQQYNKHDNFLGANHGEYSKGRDFKLIASYKW